MIKTSRLLVTTCALGFALYSGCGSDKGATSVIGEVGGTGGQIGGTGGAGTGGGVSTGGTGAVGTGGFGGGIIDSGGSTGGGGPIINDACASSDFTAEPDPIDMYIMFDHSTSMLMPPPGGGAPFWDQVVPALEAFVDDPTNAGIRVGIQFFGLVTGGTDSCNPADYANPAVPIQDLPGVANAIKMSLAANRNTGQFTPTGPALDGALQFAKTHAAANPARRTVVVLVTDGLPTVCMPTSPSAIAPLAMTAATTAPEVLTFVVGIGSATANLDTIARAGGTGSAFIIQDATNVAAEFAQAINSIATSNIPCDLEVPAPTDGGMTNPNQVNVTFTPSVGAPTPFLRVTGIGDCGRAASNGWYYDDPISPSRIILCPETCTAIGAGTLNVVLGCDSIIPM